MLNHRYLPAVVTEGIVFVAKIGATVAAATGVPVLKIVFCREKSCIWKTVENVLKNLTVSACTSRHAISPYKT